jgi:hypothetical protein
MRTSSRRTGRTYEKLPPHTIRKDAHVVGGCREKNQRENVLVDTGHEGFGEGGCDFSFISRIFTRNSGI